MKATIHYSEIPTGHPLHETVSAYLKVPFDPAITAYELLAHVYDIAPEQLKDDLDLIGDRIYPYKSAEKDIAYKHNSGATGITIEDKSVLHPEALEELKIREGAKDDWHRKDFRAWGLPALALPKSYAHDELPEPRKQGRKTVRTKRNTLDREPGQGHGKG